MDRNDIKAILAKRRLHDSHKFHNYNRGICECGALSPYYPPNAMEIYLEHFKFFSKPEAVMHMFLNNIQLPLELAQKDIIERAIDCGITPKIYLHISDTVFNYKNDLYLDSKENCDYFEKRKTKNISPQKTFYLLNKDNLLYDEDILYAKKYVIETKEYNEEKVLDFLEYLCKKVEKDLDDKVNLMSLHDQYDSHDFVGNVCSCGLIKFEKDDDDDMKSFYEDNIQTLTDLENYLLSYLRKTNKLPNYDFAFNRYIYEKYKNRFVRIKKKDR